MNSSNAKEIIEGQGLSTKLVLVVLILVALASFGVQALAVRYFIRRLDHTSCITQAQLEQANSDLANAQRSLEQSLAENEKLQEELQAALYREYERQSDDISPEELMELNRDNAVDVREFGKVE